MKDVARIADVSLQTVSTVVNEKPGVTLETRRRVLAAVEQLGYRPYSVARSLRTGRTRTIALVISDIANQSFATMASAAEVHAHANGYSLMLYNTHDDPQREASYIEIASERWVDGILFVAAEDRLDGLAALDSAGIPCVAIDRIPQGYTGPSVTLDNVAAGRIAAAHLLALGHTHMAHISGPLHLRLSQERQEGFQTQIEAHSAGCALVACAEGDWTCAAGYNAMRAILEQRQPLTAVFAANDRMAMGAMAALTEAGLRVPEHVSIVGLDDIEVSAYQHPPLTTVQQDFGELATAAVRLLLYLLAGDPPPTTQIVMQPQLIVRKSTCSAAAAPYP